MPATTDLVYQTSISINGKVDDSLLKALQAVDKGTGQIVKQEQNLGRESKKAGDAVKKSLSEMTAKTKELGIAMKDLLLPILGISVAFKGLATIGDVFQAAIDKARGAREAVNAYKATLRDIYGKNAPRAEKMFTEQQTDFLSRAMGMIDEKGNPIYTKGLIRNIQEKLSRAHIRPGEDMIRAVLERAVSEKGGLGITNAETEEVISKIRNFVMTPAARLSPDDLTALGINTKEERKAVSAMSARAKAEFIQRKFGAYRDIENLIQGEPITAEAMAVHARKMAALGEAGGPLAELQQEGEIVSESLELAFLPALKVIADGIRTMLDEPMRGVKDRISEIATEMQNIFSPSDKSDPTGRWHKLTTGIGKDMTLWDRMKQGWDDMIRQMQEDWKHFTEWAGGQWANWKRYAHATEFISPGVYVEKHPMEARIDDFIQGIIDNAVHLGKIAADIGQISWTVMQSAVVDLASAAKELVIAVQNFNLGRFIFGTPPTYVPGSTEEAKTLDEQYRAFEERLESKPGFGGAHALGGFINEPQYGLIGEAGPESIIPLKQDANTLSILGATLANLQINPFDPNAYGHEMFDAMRATFGLGAGYGGPPGFSGYSGGIYYTEYGPAVPGDQPGGPTYDYNSYHRIGAWPGITGPLEPGDVALGYGAQSFYGVSPGQTFVDTRGNTVRFADRSGSGNPMNEDVFRMAAGGIVSRRILSWLGESGKEAVVPLEGNKGRRALGSLGSKEHHFHFNPTINISGIASQEVAEYMMEEMERRFANFLDRAAFEHDRTAFN